MTTAGCGLLAVLYGGTVNDRVYHLWFSIYMHVTATSARLPRFERLTPTENEARYHVYRVYLQILHGKLLLAMDNSPEQWGLGLDEGKCISIVNKMDIAPSDIMKVVCCKCNAECRVQDALWW